ncbi:MAG TPA: glycosyltransferase family 4 protein [Opitutus sp.]|nr:glycosyltransferase family 4 protein [Opitutus sp.]
MPRVVFINRFYWPAESATAQLLTDLAEALARTGHEVTVLTSAPAMWPQRRETRAGVLIHRVSAIRWSRRHIPGRIADFITFYAGCALTLLSVARRHDMVVAMTDPPLVGALAWLIATSRGARVVQWIQDIYPEVAAGLTGQRWLTILCPLRDFVWRRSAACVVPGSDMARAPHGAGVASDRILVSPNWAPAGVAPAEPAVVADRRRAWDLDGKFVIGYSGNLGRVHDLVPLIELAEGLRDDPAIAFVIVGEGAQRAALQRLATARKLPVRFLPPQPRHNLSASLGAIDLHLVTLRPEAERWVFPSKLYGVAAAGRPVLFIGPPEAEIAQLVRQHRLGAAFSREATPDMLRWIRALRNDPGELHRMQAAATQFAAGGFPTALSTWNDILARGLAANPRNGYATSATSS